ncbi:MAG: hypothetical protein KIH01_02875 [Candidatus Freyarchaeota archaeon]|nr:hypothetical protein [Candidatus Jordarchaeia archaeon]
MGWLRKTVAWLRNPPNIVLIVALLVFFLFVLSGGVHLMLNPPQISFGFINTNIQDQYLTEGIVVAILIFIGFMGMAFVYEATKNVYNPSYATKLLAVGLILTIIAVILLHWLLIQKAPWLFRATR